MKHTSLNIISFILISLLIWYGGPLLEIANQTPLAASEKRFYIIAVIFLAWLLKFIFVHVETKSTEPKLHALQGRFQGAINFLKKNTVTNKLGAIINLSQLPWYLLIGPKGSGKTTLLANSTVNFILAKQQFKPENLKMILPSDTCDWWVTRDHVLVDIPGTYITVKNQQQPSADNILWNNLLNLIKKFRPQHTLRGILITLHLPELIKQQSNQQKNRAFYDIKKRIIDLKKQFGDQMPFYLIITKCDLLPGFVDFFTESSSDELTQAWGITLPKINENENLIDIFTQRFNALIKRLNKQLIWRLHQERNSNARSYIKDFPLQIERLKEALTNFIKALAIPNLYLNSVYLTSATQFSTEEQTPHLPSMANHFSQQALQIISSPSIPARTHFVKQLILQCLSNSNDPQPTFSRTQKIWRHRLAYALSIGTVITAAVFLGQDFQQSIQKAYSIQNDLAQYQLFIQQPNPQGDHLIKALPLLNALQEAANTKHPLAEHTHVLSFYSNKSQQTATTVYNQALQTIVIPEIKHALEKYIQASTEKNPEHLYAALKAYLMLNDSQHLQVTFIANALRQLIPDVFDKQVTDDLSHHISAAINTAQQPIDLNMDLVTQARKQLTSLPNLDLAYVILKDIGVNNMESAISLGTNTPEQRVFVSKAVANQIPNMFTADSFESIVEQEITPAATESLQGNWVIGNNFSTTQDPVAVSSLAEQLRTKYIANYVDVWESLLANIQLAAPKDLTQADAIITSLTGNNSPLLQLLQTINRNAAFEPITTASPKLQALNTLLASANNNQQNSLYQLFVSLRQLHLYLQPMLQAPDRDKAVFEATALRMQISIQDSISQLHQIAEQNPEPLKTLLNNLATQIWNNMLQETSHYIENAWEENIIPVYNSRLANRFPFSQEASQEVDLQQFTHFFAKQGALDTFYKHYLKPFVNDADQVWQWRSVDNQRLLFSDDILNQLQHASNIQHAFFPNGDNTLYVQFTLQPVAMEKTAKNFHLNINGQRITYQQNIQQHPHVLAWPGANNTHATTLNFITEDNQLINGTAKGDWGWFRLVNQNTQHILSKKKLVLQFNLAGHSAKYWLFTPGHFNPFLPLNLQSFHLPQQLNVTSVNSSHPDF